MGLELLRRTNCHRRVGCSDHLLCEHVCLVAATVPTNPRRKVESFGLALRSQQLVEGALILRLHVRKIRTKIREGLGQSLSIVEIGKRKGDGPHTSVKIPALDDCEEFLRRFI